MAGAPVTSRFIYRAEAAGTEFRLEFAGAALPFDSWALEAPDTALPGIATIQRLIAAGKAIAEDQVALVQHDAVAELSTAEAASLDLPPLAEAVARITTGGLINRPDFRAALQWCRPNGQAIVQPKRTGAWLRIGGREGRLSAPLFAIAESVDALAAAPDDTARMQALIRLQEVLPGALANGAASGGGIAASITVLQADAFSLDASGDARDPRIRPILHRAGTAEPLLDGAVQTAFADSLFGGFKDARPLYALPGNVFVFVTPVLRRALQVVREQLAAPASRRRAFLAEPRRFLTEAFEVTDDPTLVDRVEDVVVETSAWSDRVLGLGLWTKRPIPWLQKPFTQWFGPEGETAEVGGIEIDGQRLPLKPDEADALADSVRAARIRGEASVECRMPDGSTRRIETSEAVEVDLRAVAAAQRPKTPGEPKTPEPERQTLLIKPNLESLDHEDEFVPRASLPTTLPASLRSQLKPHQEEGLEWLMRCWLAGRPGVLLADDMGLGKTLQGLVFLAWLREAIEGGMLPRAPVLIVAPTGLLANWQAEHEIHLRVPGLGRLLPAHGKGLADIRLRDADGVPRLDTARIAAADWVLTTYETLRDHLPEFGEVHFAAVVMDEAQKVKTPAIRITDAAKGVRADFKVAMTGTPVENHLVDLWCIVDTVHSGFLRELKEFSQTYVGPQVTEDRLATLKKRMEAPFGGAPGILLRRLRRDRLPDLPSLHQHEREVLMPPAQVDAYEGILTFARQGGGNQMLIALQRLRKACLHPDPDMSGNDAAFIAASARMTECFRILDEVNAKGEAALIFLEERDIQARLATLLQRRYRLLSPPFIISGAVAGPARQTMVDRFQDASGFGVMVLSPKAGGVGLTLTRANHVIHLSRWWNPAVEDQCTGRALRIGQRREVHVHLPIAVLPEGDSAFDQNLHRLLERKRRLMEQTLAPPEPSEGEAAELFARTVGGVPG